MAPPAFDPVEYAKKETIEKAIRAVHGSDDYDTAMRVAGVITQHIRIDLSDMQKGLRSVHKNFAAVNSKLQALYPSKEEKLQWGLCCLLSHLCADKVLRDKLIRAGAAEHLTSLLPRPTASYFALRTLSILTSHAGPTEGEIIAKLTAVPLVELAKSMDTKDARYPLVISVLMHGSYVGNSKTGVNTLDMINVLAQACSHPDSHTHTHAIEGLNSMVWENQKLFRTTPRLVKIIVAHLRHPDPRERLNSVWTLYSVVHGPAVVETTSFDPRKLTAGFNKLTRDMEIKEAINAFGPGCDVVSLLSSSLEYQKAIQEAYSTRDFYKLGTRLIKVLMQSEFGIADGVMQMASTKPHPVKGGLDFQTAHSGPFTSFVETLPMAAKALRERDPESLDATCLDIKYLMIRRRWTEAHPIAEKALEKYPECTYLCYCLSIANVSETDGLRWAKKGLKTDAQGYIQRGLLQTSAEHSIAIAGACISDGWAKYCSAEQRFEVALAHIRGAFSDIKTYLDVSPPDSRYLPIMILRYLNLAPVLFGIDGLSPSLHELSAHSKRLKLTDRISDILYNGPVNTQQRLAWEIMQKHYEEAAKEWDPIFAGFDEVHESLKTGFTGLEKMMDELKCGGHSEPRSKGHYLVPEITNLLMCSYCGSPSAKLKKCSRCNKARYCDAKCQQKGWKMHKPSCLRV